MMRTLLPVILACLVVLVSSVTIVQYNFPQPGSRFQSNHDGYSRSSMVAIPPQPWDVDYPYNIFPKSSAGANPKQVCGVVNGVFKTFSCLDEFLEYVRNGYAFTLYCYGPCPPTQSKCTAIYEPICASNLITTKTFSSPCAMGEENYRTGSIWIQISSGPCPVLTPTATPIPCGDTTTPAPGCVAPVTATTSSPITTPEATIIDPVSSAETTLATSTDTTQTPTAVTTPAAESTTVPSTHAFSEVTTPPDFTPTTVTTPAAESTTVPSTPASSDVTSLPDSSDITSISSAATSPAAESTSVPSSPAPSDGPTLPDSSDTPTTTSTSTTSGSSDDTTLPPSSTVNIASATENVIAPLFQVEVANDILTPPSEDVTEPSTPLPLDTISAFLKALRGWSIKDLPAATRVSVRNNVNNKYNIYAEGNICN